MNKKVPSSSHSENEIITEEEKKTIISKANVIKEDIDQLLMYLGANHNLKAIAQKMDQLGRNAADLDSHIYNCYGRRRQTAGKPNRATSKARRDAMLH